MKLFSLRLTTLKSKLYAIVFASFVVRVVAFFALPNTASSFAPDEGSYAGLAEVVAMGVPEDKTQFRENLYLSSRALVLPSSLLIRLGLSGLDAVRLIASVYGLLTVLLLTVLLLKLSDSRQEVSNYISKNHKVVLTFLTIFALLPSHLIWSVLGLRETAIEFWVAVVFMFVFYVFEVKKSPSKSTLLGLLIVIPLVFSSRPQVGWVVGSTLLIYFFIKVRVRASQILIPVTLLGIVLGYVVNPAVGLFDQVEAINQRHEGNKVGASSAINTPACPITDDSRFQKYFCIAYKAPYTTYTFLVRPLLGADVTSSSSLFAAIENTFWLGAFLFVILMLIRNRRLAFFGALAPSLLFFSIYSVAAGAYEGNMGTAFRHKSLILWVVLLLIASTIVATQQRKAQQQGISGSSQE